MPYVLTSHVTVRGGRGGAVIVSHTAVEARALAALLSEAILKASHDLKPPDHHVIIDFID